MSRIKLINDLSDEIVAIVKLFTATGLDESMVITRIARYLSSKSGVLSKELTKNLDDYVIETDFGLSEINAIKKAVHSVFGSLSDIRETDVPGTYLIITPLLDKHNDHIEIYLWKTNDGTYILSDDSAYYNDSALRFVMFSFSNTYEENGVKKYDGISIGGDKAKDQLWFEVPADKLVYGIQYFGSFMVYAGRI